MSISYPPTPTPVATGVNANVLTITTTSSQIVAANPARTAGSMIVNNSSKPLWIRLDTLPAAPNAINSLSIPASGGNYLLPASYQGGIQGIFPAAATGNVQFIEPFI
jgi:hypothetical protein